MCITSIFEIMVHDQEKTGKHWFKGINLTQMTTTGGQSITELVLLKSWCRLFSSGDHGNNEHLQAAEVQAGAERLQPLHYHWAPLCVGLPAEGLHPSDRQYLQEYPRGRAQAIGLTGLGMMRNSAQRGMWVSSAYCSVSYLMKPWACSQVEPWTEVWRSQWKKLCHVSWVYRQQQ